MAGANGSITEEYLRRHPRSAERFQAALQVFPAGVTHDVRHVTPFPVFMAKGEGALKWDIDGNEYVDYMMGHGAMLLGHSHPDVVAAVTAALPLGTQLGANTEAELNWAKAVQALMPSAERIRFHSSGTEASMMAFRIARAATGRDRIITFEHHFHGWHDYVAASSGRYEPNGIPATTRSTVTTIAAGDSALVETTIRDAGDVAAVIIEPTGGAMGYYALPRSFLADLRELTSQVGVLLIFDEVVTGFRVSSGGAQERYGVRPDLTTLAKILSGGLPGGAVTGRADLMSLLSYPPEITHEHRVGHPGTFNANPVSAAAGACCLGMLVGGAMNDRAERAATRLRLGIQETITARGIDAFCHQRASLVWVAFGGHYDGDPTLCTAPFNILREGRSARYLEPFKRAMLNRGVDPLGGAFIVSAVHDDELIGRSVAAVGEALDDMKRDGALD